MKQKAFSRNCLREKAFFLFLFARARIIAAFGALRAFRSGALLAAEALAPAVLARPPASVARRLRVRMYARFAVVAPFGCLTAAALGVLLLLRRRLRSARPALVPAMLALLAAALSAALMVMALVAGALSLTTLSPLTMAWLPLPGASPMLGAASVRGIALSAAFGAFGCGSRNRGYGYIRHSCRAARTFLKRPAH